MHQKYSLTPGSVDFIPVHRHCRRAPQTKAADGCEWSLVPDVKGIIVDIGRTQPLQMCACPLHLQHTKGLHYFATLELFSSLLLVMMQLISVLPYLVDSSPVMRGYITRSSEVKIHQDVLSIKQASSIMCKQGQSICC